MFCIDIPSLGSHEILESCKSIMNLKTYKGTRRMHFLPCYAKCLHLEKRLHIPLLKILLHAVYCKKLSSV